MMNLTPKQDVLLSYLRLYARVHNCAPSYRQMAHGIGLKSVSNIHRLIVSLEARGHITRDAGRYRSVLVVGNARDLGGSKRFDNTQGNLA